MSSSETRLNEVQRVSSLQQRTRSLPNELNAKVCGHMLDDATCTADGYTELVRNLMHFCNGDRAYLARRFSTTCVADVRRHLGTMLSAQFRANPFPSGAKYWGTWWLADRGVTEWYPGDRSAVGLLYIRLEPWGGLSLYSMLWVLDKKKEYENPLDLVLVQYSIVPTHDGESPHKINMQIKTPDVARPFPFPTAQTVPSFDDAVRRTFGTGAPSWSKKRGVYADFWPNNPRLWWMILEVVRGRAPQSLGVDVHQLEANEWVLGLNNHHHYQRYHA